MIETETQTYITAENLNRGDIFDFAGFEYEVVDVLKTSTDRILKVKAFAKDVDGGAFMVHLDLHQDHPFRLKS
jgi:hypothetical protein